MNLINITIRHVKAPRVGSGLLLLALMLTIPASVQAAGPYEISRYTIDGGIIGEGH